MRTALVWTLLASFLATEGTRAGIDPAALERLVQRAEESESDALVVLQDGELVGEWYFGKPRSPIEAMSVTKSVVALGIGRLIDQGKIASVDEPVHTFFPEWKQGRKQEITVRQLLNHTSGLQNVPNTNVEIYPSNDFVQLALAAELSHDPGEQFAYNNKAMNLLAGVVQVASGKRMDIYIGEEIFDPLGIVEFGWTLDPAGNPHAMSGLQIHARDLAKLGQLVLDRGTWEGKRILSEAFLDQMLAPRDVGSFYYGPPYGLLWWLVPEWKRTTLNDEIFTIWREAGVDEQFLAKVEPLRGKVWDEDDESFFPDIAELLGGEDKLEEWYDNTWRRNLPDAAVLRGPIVAYRADGYLGQYVVIVPGTKIVAVRQRRSPDTANAQETVDSFAEFSSMVLDLASP